MGTSHVYTIAIAALTLLAATGRAGTIYSTDGTATPGFDASAHSTLVYHCVTPGPFAVWPGTGCSSNANPADAYQFAASVTGIVASISVALEGVVNGGAILSGSEVFEILTDSSGSPGTVVDTITIGGITSSAQILSGNSTQHPVLTAGTPYWLEANAPVFGPGVTDFTVDWDAASPHLAGNEFGGSSSTTSAIGAFAIESTAPEPATVGPLGLTLLLLACAMYLRRRTRVQGTDVRL